MSTVSCPRSPGARPPASIAACECQTRTRHRSRGRRLTALRRILFAVLLTALCAAGCSGGSPGPAATRTLEPLSAAGRGQTIFFARGRCGTCHSLAPDTIIVGPSLAAIASRSASRVAGLTPAEYLEQSIVSPDAYKAPGFENQQMDPSLAKTLTAEDVDDLVAFLLTLR